MRYKLKANFIKGAGAGTYGDGGGLILRKRNEQAGKWLFRHQSHGVRRDIGLGGFPDVSLAAARKAADAARQAVLAGHDPKASRTRAVTFNAAAKQYIDEKVRTRLKNAKAIAQWEATISTYASPVFGSVPVSDVTPSHVERALRPIWTTKVETAKRLHGRLKNVFAWAIASGLRTASNPTDGMVDILPHAAKANVHHAALGWRDMPEFWAKLQSVNTPAAVGLRFLILTACRSGEVRGATWDEVDSDAGVWTIPAARMKAQQTHRVPLSQAAQGVLEALRGIDPELCFNSARRGKSLSENAFRMPIRALGYDVTAHGFRSSFRDWAAETQKQPSAVIEACLAHGNPDKVEAAYLRTDFFDARREVMESWARFVTGD